MASPSAAPALSAEDRHARASDRLSPGFAGGEHGGELCQVPGREPQVARQALGVLVDFGHGDRLRTRPELILPSLQPVQNGFKRRVLGIE
ncbi:MAG: hypothetical protein ACK5NX_01255 [Armatimonadota bacterium]